MVEALNWSDFVPEAMPWVLASALGEDERRRVFRKIASGATTPAARNRREFARELLNQELVRCRRHPCSRGGDVWTFDEVETPSESVFPSLRYAACVNLLNRFPPRRGAVLALGRSSADLLNAAQRLRPSARTIHGSVQYGWSNLVKPGSVGLAFVGVPALENRERPRFLSEPAPDLWRQMEFRHDLQRQLVAAWIALGRSAWLVVATEAQEVPVDGPIARDQTREIESLVADLPGSQVAGRIAVGLARYASSPPGQRWDQPRSVRLLAFKKVR